jgi:hypothetical protein
VVHRDDDLTDPQNVVDAMTGVVRMFFSMSGSPDYLQATAVVSGQ